MSLTLATVLVNMDVSSGASAIDYNNSVCPILGFNCIGSSGSGVVKLTSLRATSADVLPGPTSGEGARLRLVTGGNGNITSVEIAQAGSGYPNGPIQVSLNDPYGNGGIISGTASGGAVTAVSVTNSGAGYSGYIAFDVSDFIEGVTYDIVPRYIEQTSGSGTLRLMGYKLSYRPFQVF